MAPPPLPGGGGGAYARPKVRCRNLHWSKVPPSQIRGSVWETLESDLPREELGVPRTAEIEALFSAAPPKKKGGGGAAEGPAQASKRRKSPAKISLIDPQRAHNVNISLGRLKALRGEREDWAPLAEALNSVDCEAIDAEVVEMMLNMLPTDEECGLFRSFDAANEAKLGNADRFMFTVTTRCPRARQRLRSIEVLHNFRADASAVEDAADLYSACSEELLASGAFKAVLQASLYVGNHVNGGGSKGGAQGFRIKALQQLRTVKSNTKMCPTMLHFIVRVIEKRPPVVPDAPDDADGAAPPAEDDVAREALGVDSWLQQPALHLEAELTKLRDAAGLPGLAILEADLRVLDAGVKALAAECEREARLLGKGGAEDAGANPSPSPNPRGEPADDAASETVDGDADGAADGRADGAAESPAVTPGEAYVRKMAPFVRKAQARVAQTRRAFDDAAEKAEKVMGTLCDDGKGPLAERHLALLALLSNFLGDWQQAQADLDKIALAEADKRRRRLEAERRKAEAARLKLERERASAAAKEAASGPAVRGGRAKVVDSDDLFGSFFDMQDGAAGAQLADQFTNFRSRLARRRQRIVAEGDGDSVASGTSSGESNEAAETVWL